MKGIIVGIAIIVGLIGVLTGGLFGGGSGGLWFHVAETECSSVSVRFVGGDSGDEQQLCFSGGSSPGPRRHLFIAGDAEWAVAVVRDYWQEPRKVDLERFLDLVLDYADITRADSFGEPFRFEAYDIVTFTANLREQGETIIHGCFGFLRHDDAAETSQQIYGFYCRAGTDEISKSGIGSVLRRVKSRDA